MMGLKRWIGVLACVAVLCAGSVARAADAGKKKIVLVAGKDSHGRGEHEFRAGCMLLAKSLNEFPGVEAVTTFDGWPADNAIFENAAAVVVYADGGGKHPTLPQLVFLESLASKGVGIGCMHYGCEIPKGPGGDALTKWIGGYYEDGFSINPHWKADAILNPDHAITRGAKTFNLKDEWYFNIRFPEDKKGWSSILEMIPDDEARSGKTSWPRGPKKHIVEASGRKETLLWAVERPEGGRGFGFTGGHFHSNWADDNYRKLILNAIVWIAKVDVPAEGVPSKTPTAEELDANQKPAKKK